MHAIDRPLSQALRDITSLINSSVDLTTTLRHLVHAACHHTVWSMAGIMSIDQTSGHALVVARHDPNLLAHAYKNRWTLVTSPSLVALTRNEPVIIRDAQTAHEYPGYQKEAIERGYRTVVVLPLGCKDAMGHAMVLSVQSREVIDLTEIDLTFLETVVHLGAIAVDKAHRLTTERLTAERLQNALTAHSALMHKVLSDGSVASATAMIKTFLPNPVVVVDLTANLVIFERSPAPDLIDDATWKASFDKTLSRQFLRLARDVAKSARLEPTRLYLNCGGHHLNLPALLEPLLVDGEAAGVLVVFSENADLGNLDHLLLESAKFALSVQMMRSYVRFRSESQTSSELFAEIVSGRWRSFEDVAARARRLGIEVDAQARLVAISIPADTKHPVKTSLELHRSITRIAEQQNPPATAVALDDIIVCRVPSVGRDSDAAAKVLVAKIMEEASWLLDTTPVAVISKPCSSLQEYPIAWRECERKIKLAVRYNRKGLLSVEDFGPSPILLSAVNSEEVRSFIEVTIGSVTRYDEENRTEYNKTLALFLGHGCRHQACADAMGLHVTTLRYRLSRIRELFGIEIDTPERRFALELAIRLHDTLADGSSA